MALARALALGIGWYLVDCTLDPMVLQKMKRSYVPINPTLQRRWDKMDQARMVDPGRITESA